MQLLQKAFLGNAHPALPHPVKCLQRSKPYCSSVTHRGQALFPLNSPHYASPGAPSFRTAPWTLDAASSLLVFFFLSRNSLSSLCASTPTTWNGFTLLPGPPMTLPQLKEVIDFNPSVPLTNLNQSGNFSENSFLNCSNNAGFMCYHQASSSFSYGL